MTIRRRFAVTVRGFRLLKIYCPGLVQGKALYELINSLQPFVTVWFAAQILNELSARQGIRKTAIYVVSMILIHFICSVAKNSIDRICSEKETQMWKWFGKIFSDKQMSLDFEDLENAEIQRQKQEAEENLYMFGNGLGQLVWGTSGLVKASVNILASLAMAGSLFLSKSGNSVIDNPIWMMAVLLCILLGGLGNSKATVKENQIFLKWCQNTVWFNRTFMFFGKELYIKKKEQQAALRRKEARRKKVIQEIERLEKELADITDRLYGEDATDYVKAAQLEDQRIYVEDQLMQLYEEEANFSIAQDVE